MKKINLPILLVTILLLATASFWWTVVEFILYLVKDSPFNWISLVSYIILFIAYLVAVIALKYKEL